MIITAEISQNTFLYQSEYTIFFYELIFVLLSKSLRILSNFFEITEKSYVFFDEQYRSRTYLLFYV